MTDGRSGRKTLLAAVHTRKGGLKELHSATMAPEYELMLAILDRAIRDAIGVKSDANHYRADALRWFWSDSEEPWSYLWLCQMLELTDTVMSKIMCRISLDD